MADKETSIWEKLRKPFDPQVIGKIPKGGIQLDYVGHAAVTDRLLSVDPEWTWEPLAVNEYGLPILDDKNGLWIKLTVGGVTRLGYGDGPDNKQRIGDALRNAAMRFGVALDLWTKDELESNIEHPENKNTKSRPAMPKKEQIVGEGQVHPDVIKKAGLLMVKHGYKKGIQETTDFLNIVIGKEQPETAKDYTDIIEALESSKGDNKTKSEVPF